MSEEYLIGLFRKAIIEAKAENLACIGEYLMRNQSLEAVCYRVRDNESMEALLRDEKALRKLAKAVIEAAK